MHAAAPSIVVDYRQRPIPAGWVRIVFHISSEAGGGRLWLDLGGGFNERHAVWLPGAKAGRQVTHVMVPKAIMRLRVEIGRTAFEREKQGSPVDPDLCEWPEDYFAEHIWFDRWPDELTVRAIALDPSKGHDARRGDYSAFVMLGVDGRGVIYVEADLARRPTPQMVADGVVTQAARGQLVVFEDQAEDARPHADGAIAQCGDLRVAPLERGEYLDDGFQSRDVLEQLVRHVGNGVHFRLLFGRQRLRVIDLLHQRRWQRGITEL